MSKTIEMSRSGVEPIRKAAEELAEKLNRLPCENLKEAGEEGSCMKRERDRRWRGLLRPTQYMLVKKMCGSCAASWYAEMASMTLDSLARGLR